MRTRQVDDLTAGNGQTTARAWARPLDHLRLYRVRVPVEDLAPQRALGPCDGDEDAQVTQMTGREARRRLRGRARALRADEQPADEQAAGWSMDEAWSLPVEKDTSAEVDACFRAQRRVALGYFTLFVAVTLAVPGLTLVLDWWSGARVVGGMSPNFAMAAFGIYAFFFAIALAAALLANAVEDGMLGGRDDGFDEDPPP